METIYWIVGYVLSLIALGFLIVYTGRRNAKEFKFDLMYENFKTMLYDPSRPITKESWKELNRCFTEIEGMNMFSERTDILRGEFLKRYKPVRDEIDREYKELMSENEFDPGQIFAGE